MPRLPEFEWINTGGQTIRRTPMPFLSPQIWNILDKNANSPVQREDFVLEGTAHLRGKYSPREVRIRTLYHTVSQPSLQLFNLVTSHDFLP